jgi:hypothetical protein
MLGLSTLYIMQLSTCKRLLGMDNSSHESNDGEIQIDGSPEKGSNPSGENESEEEETRYPPFKTVMLSMSSIYLAFFLSALVSLLVEPGLPRRWLTIIIGSYDHWRRHTRHI